MRRHGRPRHGLPLPELSASSRASHPAESAEESMIRPQILLHGREQVAKQRGEARSASHPPRHAPATGCCRAAAAHARWCT
ncbi:hypothetical protein SETIT_1G300300v2, partial [Setaria italica]